jgi:exonuclease SbcD
VESKNKAKGPDTFMSTTPEVHLLAIGDVHLGTRPGSLPEDLADVGLGVEELTPEAALAIAVDRAIELKVHAVLFAGDLVESTNARFEAMRPLERAVAKLQRASIPAIAVVGNHDVEALPRLVTRIPGLEIVGAGGKWQARTIEVGGQPAAEIVGWSFPKLRVSTSPVAELIAEPLPKSDLPRIGLLHGDLDASGGHYAPFTSTELRDAGLDAWLLGHIHKPSFGDDNAVGVPSGYLGSLLGLSPKETGPHGPWLIKVAGTGAITHEQLPLSPLRWRHIELAIEEGDSTDDIGDKVSRAAETEARKLDGAGCAPRALGLRIELIGRTGDLPAVRKWCEDERWQIPTVWVADSVVFVNRVSQALEPAYDLIELALGDDPLALMAKKMLVLKTAGAQRDGLLADARIAMQGTADHQAFSELDERRDAESPLSEATLIETLTWAGTRALDDLVAQRRQRSVQQVASEVVL